MSQSRPVQRPDVDPLLAFSIEPGVQPPLPQPNKPVPPPQVAASPADRAYVADLIATRLRIDRLEKAVEQAMTQVSVLKSEVATLVGVTADISKHISRDESVAAPSSSRSSRSPRKLQLTTAVAGVLVGVTAGFWIWMSTANELLVTPPPTSEATEQSTPPAPPPAAAIVPVAAIAPAAPARPTTGSTTAPSPRVGYVGTLSIDSDPAGDVFIDRRPAGRTPVRAANLKAGSHLIWIQRDGYTRFTRVVQVSSGRVTRLVADLDPVPAR